MKEINPSLAQRQLGLWLFDFVPTLCPILSPFFWREGGKPRNPKVPNHAVRDLGQLFSAALATFLLSASPTLHAQAPAPARQQKVGDQPAVALPMATDVSGKLTHRAVRHAISKVADWQLQRAEPDFDQDWTYAAMYVGFMAVPDAAGGRKYREA